MNNEFESAVPADKAIVSCPFSPAISWSAVVGGGLVAASISLVLLVLGTGFGLASVSPWSAAGASTAGFTLGAMIWLIIMQWVASGLGGYITGRMRKRWPGLHEHEVFFRDTAHGFLTWALATLIAVSITMSAASAVVTGGTKAATVASMGAVAGNTAGASEQNTTIDPLSYYVDGLFRSSNPANANDRDVRVETTRIFMMDLKNGMFSDGDKTYLSQVVVARTGITSADADTRVNNAIQQASADKEKAKEATDKARKVAATTAVFTALSMFIGAFIACVAAALGGQRREQY